MEELLSLKWNNHRSTFLHILTILRDKQLYTDATLACEGRFYSVHRLVLSTCSDYFSAMFDRTTCKNPIIVLKDIKCEDLEALLDYMYLGEVNVRQADLASLIKAAECLRVKGLAVPDDEPPQKRGRGDTSNLRRAEGAGSPPSKRKRREEAQDGREDIRPGGGSNASARPKTPQSQSRLSPVPQDGSEATTSSPGHHPLSSSELPSQGTNSGPPASVEGDTPFVKVEMEDSGGDDMGVESNSFNINNTGYKEEGDDNDAGDPGGDLSNDLPEFLQQAAGSHLGSSFGHGSFPGTSSFQSGDMGWQGEGSNLNFPSHLNYSSSTETSSQNAPGVSASLASLSSENLGSNPGTMCLVCGKTFHSVWHMTRHLRTHTGERPFPCPFCPYRATQKNALQRHIQNLHHQGSELNLPPQKRKGATEGGRNSSSSSKITSFAALIDSHLLDSSFLESRLFSSCNSSTAPISASSTPETSTTTTTTTTTSTSPTTSQRTNSLPSFSRALSSMISGSNHTWPSMFLSDSLLTQDLLLPNQ